MSTRAPAYSYKIVAGANNAGNLVNIETITATGDSAPFYPPEAYSSYDPGQANIRGDGTVYLAGFGRARWHFKKLTRAQWSYLQSTYCSGGYSGAVTIATRTGSTSYANFSAILILPKPSDMQRNFVVWTDVDILFTRLVAL
jgi:hypothetical protein